MVFYVRFLKTPRLQKDKSAGLRANALICITTDLGDAFLAEDAPLLVQLVLEDSGKVVNHQTVQWEAGCRELQISLGPVPRRSSMPAFVLYIGACPGTSSSSTPRQCDDLSGNSVPLILSAWSAPFGGHASVADKLVERRLALDNALTMRIWEETGNSIARHIWDAALAAIMFVQAVMSDVGETMPSFRYLLRASRGKELRILELGSGCGIVGIGLATLHRNCSVLLTDLPEVEEIVATNIAAATPQAASTLHFKTLDWDEEIPQDISSDLIVVSDCTYNVDSLPALVGVLQELVTLSPSAIVLVALKRRHDSEAVFFDLMRAAELRKLDQDSIELPSHHGQADRIEFYTFTR